VGADARDAAARLAKLPVDRPPARRGLQRICLLGDIHAEDASPDALSIRDNRPLGKNILRDFFALVGPADTEVEVPPGDAQRSTSPTCDTPRPKAPWTGAPAWRGRPACFTRGLTSLPPPGLPNPEPRGFGAEPR